jgi:predicted DNA-binding ribbon-helix-helix protein
MNQKTPKQKTTNTQSIRMPMELYERVAELALHEDVSMTNMIIKLVNLGLGHQVNFEKAVRDFVFRIVTRQEVERMANGE